MIMAKLELRIQFVKMLHILPKPKKIGHGNIYTPGRGNRFFCQLSTVIGLAINFGLVQWKIYTPKYNGSIEGGLSSQRYNKTARRFYGALKKETEVS